MVPADWASWPRSLLALPTAAFAFAAQAVPVLGLFLAMVRAEYLPGAIIYAGAMGVACEALFGRALRLWLMLPLAGLLLSAAPRWMKNQQGMRERDRVAGEDQTGPGPGADGLGVLVDRPEVARILAQRYAVTATYARRDVTSVDFIAFHQPGVPTDAVAASSLPEEPAGVLTVSTTASSFERGRIEGYDLRTTATWPDGRQRARVGVQISQVGLPAFPLAGCPFGPWLQEGPCRVWLAHPGVQSYGYEQPVQAEVEAAAIARLIGLAPLAISSGRQGG